MQRLVQALSWEDFDTAVAALAKLVDRTRPCIYGVPRGGLPLAVALSHATGIPLSVHPEWRMVCVDDIVDKGFTLAQIQTSYPDAQFLAWIARPERNVTAAVTLFSDDWILFPWEKPENAEDDERRYDISRK